MKSPEPTRVTIQLAETTRDFQVGLDWTECTMEMTPAAELMGSFAAVIDVSGKSEILVDEMTFRPILTNR